MKSWLKTLGVLRAALLIATIAVIACAPFAHGEIEKSGWGLMRTVIGPTLMAMLVFVLPLDITMARIFMSDMQGAERARYRSIIRIEAVLFVALLIAWILMDTLLHG